MSVHTASAYRAPRRLRSPHLQTLLSSSPIRVARGGRELRKLGAVHEEHLVDAGHDVRLHGVHSTLPGRPPRGLALLLHGWEGSAESGYMRLTCARLLERGFDVFRLNFRDHGGTHHLNVELFHSARLDEVVTAAQDLLRRVPSEHLVLAGYSLGGNFALRLALHAGEARLPLRRVAVVCPLLDPATTMDSIEHGPAMYDWYFRRKWRSSLVRKRALFPEQHCYDDATLALDMRSLTAWLAQRYAGFGTVEDYFDSYSIAGDRLAALPVPASVLMAQDDPVIPFDDFRQWRLPPSAALEVTRWGGHCAFVESLSGDGFAERWVADRLGAALPRR